MTGDASASRGACVAPTTVRLLLAGSTLTLTGGPLGPVRVSVYESDARVTFTAARWTYLRAGLSFHRPLPTHMARLLSIGRALLRVDRAFLDAMGASVSFAGTRLKPNREPMNFRDASVAFRREDLSVRDASVSLRREDLSVRDASVAFRREVLSVRDASVSFRREVLSVRDASVSFTREDLNVRDASVSLRCQDLNVRDASVSFTREDLNVRDAPLLFNRASVMLHGLVHYRENIEPSSRLGD